MFASLLTSALAFSGAARAPAPRSSVTMAAGKSAAVPFLAKPDNLPETMAGYAGFVRRIARLPAP
jgi:hypothetical protein